MSRITSTFSRLKQEGRTALVPFVTAGDPQPGTTVPLMHALAAAGADVIELGVPFSDPMAEGPAIQHACERALLHHVSLDDVLGMVREFRQRDGSTPVVIMGYLNPLEVKGYERFAADAAAAGVDGVITVDLPPEEAEEYVTILGSSGLDPVFLLSPTSSDARIRSICAHSRGFVYYVSLRGVTGAAHLDTAEARGKVDHIRSFTDLPVGVGFGISDAKSAASVAQFADAVIVGSAIVKRIEKLAAEPEHINDEVAAFVGEIRAALDKNSSSAKVTTA